MASIVLILAVEAAPHGDPIRLPARIESLQHNVPGGKRVPGATMADLECGWIAPLRAYYEVNGGDSHGK